MKIELHPKQADFLKMLQKMNGISVLKLSPDDRLLIDQTISDGCYFEHHRVGLNRLRVRWKRERPDADSNEYY